MRNRRSGKRVPDEGALPGTFLTPHLRSRISASGNVPFPCGSQCDQTLRDCQTTDDSQQKPGYESGCAGIRPYFKVGQRPINPHGKKCEKNPSGSDRSVAEEMLDQRQKQGPAHQPGINSYAPRADGDRILEYPEGAFGDLMTKESENPVNRIGDVGQSI